MRKDLRTYSNKSNRLKYRIEDIDRLSVRTLKQQREIAYDKYISAKRYVDYPKSLDKVEDFREKANTLKAFIDAIDKKLN